MFLGATDVSLAQIKCLKSVIWENICPEVGTIGSTRGLSSNKLMENLSTIRNDSIVLYMDKKTKMDDESRKHLSQEINGSISLKL